MKRRINIDLEESTIQRIEALARDEGRARKKQIEIMLKGLVGE